jgi:hypothetical protein
MLLKCLLTINKVPQEQQEVQVLFKYRVITKEITEIKHVLLIHGVT